MAHKIGFGPLAFGLALGWAATLPGLAQTPADPAALLAEIAAAKLEPARAVALSRVKLDVGFANLQLDQGVLFPSSPVNGKTVELVFEGKGKIRLQPPDPIEAQQLDFFTGQPQLEEEFTEAVLVVARDAVVQALLGKPKATPEADVASRAEAFYAEWRKKPERRILDVETSILLDTLDESSAQGFFFALFRGGRRRDFLLFIDPSQPEQATLGRFVPIDATENERRKIAREMSKEQKKGRLIGLELQDLGQWDTWVSGALKGSDGRPRPGGASFEPKSSSRSIQTSRCGRSRTGKGDLSTSGKTRDR